MKCNARNIWVNDVNNVGIAIVWELYYFTCNFAFTAVKMYCFLISISN